VKSTLIVAGMIGFATAGGFALAAPASASCAPSFTSIPCTIATNVAAAPGQLAGGLAAAPGQLAGGLAAAPGQFIRAIKNGGTDPPVDGLVRQLLDF
jgi:hypothetical protein